MNATKAEEWLNFLWSNYLILASQVDLNAMSSDTLEAHVQHNAPVRPFRILAWSARQGAFFSLWSYWECYARTLCKSYPNKVTKIGSESTVTWVARSMEANGRTFDDKNWFNSANALRNLIAHNGGQAADETALAKFARCQFAFPGISTWPDGYVAIEHGHLSDLYLKIEDFIRRE